MDVPLHNQILWRACEESSRRLALAPDDPGGPTVHFPSLVRGSWCNDLNQVSELFAALGVADSVSQFPETLFHVLWDADRAELMEDVEAYRGTSLRQAMESRFDPSSEFLFDLGVYDGEEHIDAPPNLARVEMGGELGLVENVRAAVFEHAGGRLFTAMFSSSAAVRQQPANLSALGRALHTFQDFFSHTNQVELLLWHLSENAEVPLPPALVAAFNDPLGFLDPTPSTNKRLALRGFGSAGWSRQDRIYFPYAREVGDTPVASGVFDKLDTIWSGLSVYRRHLLDKPAGEGSDQDDTVLSLAFGLVDFPRKNLARRLIGLASDFRSAIASIGDAARGFAFDALVSALVARAPEQEAAVRSAAGLLRQYDSSEANDWARAGKMAFLQYAIEEALLDKYDAYDPATAMPVPNHTLLNKDYHPAKPTEILKYNLSSWLAAKVSAEVVESYFSGADYEAVRTRTLERYFRHPARYDADLLREVGAAVQDFNVASWRRQPLPAASG